MLLRIVFCCALLMVLLTACGHDALVSPEPSGQPELAASGVIETYAWSFPHEWTLYGDCLDDNRGDLAYGQGTVHFTMKEIVTPAGILVRNMDYRYDDDFTMVGLTSGHSYTILDVSKTRSTRIYGDALFVITSFDVFRCRDDVTGRVYDWPYRLHLTWNAEGDLTAETEMFPCRAIPVGQ